MDEYLDGLLELLLKANGLALDTQREVLCLMIDQFGRLFAIVREEELRVVFLKSASNYKPDGSIITDMKRSEEQPCTYSWVSPEGV